MMTPATMSAAIKTDVGMPYKITHLKSGPAGQGYYVKNTATNEIKNKRRAYASVAEAQPFLRALYAAETKGKKK